MLTIERLRAGDAAAAQAWDAFVMACPQATFFHRAGWLRIIEEVFGHEAYFLCTKDAGQVTGVLPLAHVNSWLFGNSLTGLPFTVYGGVAAANPESAAALEAEADRLGRSLGVQHLELRHIERRHDDWPVQDLYVTFRKEILPEEEANMLAIPRKQRAMVRKGLSAGLRHEIDPDAGRFFALFADNVHRHGTPAMSRAWFEGLLQEFGNDAEVLTVLAPDGTPVSSVLSFYFRDEVLPYYAGDAPAARDLAANDYKYWALMQHAVARGARVFDYGRSKLGTGPYNFKKNWGFTPQPLSYEFQLFTGDGVPQNNPNNPKYQLMIRAWRRLPLSVANRLGPLIVKNLG